MRTARYHDYVLLKVIMFIALVGLGIFIYLNFVKPVEHVSADDVWVVEKPTCTADGQRYKVCDDCGEKFDVHTIPATGHKPGMPAKENEKDHTLTMGASYESAVYCTVCDTEISREIVWVDSAHTVEIIETKENVVEATCTTEGSYELVKTCKGCDKEIERTTEIVDAKGHDYELELVYSEDVFAVVGVCKVDGTRIVVTEETNKTFKVERDTTVAACCSVVYNITVNIDGYEFKDSMDMGKPEKNHTVEYYVDHDSYIDNKPSYLVLPDMLYDERTDRYYYDISTPGVQPVGAGAHSEWDKYGFCLGMYICYECKTTDCQYDGCADELNHIYTVFIYSAEYDTRIPEEPKPI